MTLINKINYQLWLLWENKSFKSAAKSFFSVLGAYALIIEILNILNFEEISECLNSYGWIVLISAFIYVVYDAWPKLKYSYQVKDKDVSITIQIGDIFKIRDSLIIPINNKFDVSDEYTIQKSKSILRHFIKYTYKDVHSHLESDIQSILSDNSLWYQNLKDTAKSDVYKVGTVVPISRDEKQFYLLANSSLNEHKRAKCNEDDLVNSLNGLWSYLSQCGSKDNLVIPIIGTGRGRINMKREDVVKEIVLSFIASLSSEIYCEQLTICIHPTDIRKHNININDLLDFVRLNCINTRYCKVSEQNITSIGHAIC